MFDSDSQLEENAIAYDGVLMKRLKPNLAIIYAFKNAIQAFLILIVKPGQVLTDVL